MLKQPHLWLILLLLAGCAASKAPEGVEKPENTIPAASFSNMAPKFLYLASQNALRDGDRELAAALLKALVDKDPEAIEPHLQLTSLLMQLGRTDQAETEISKLLSKPLKQADQEKLLLTQARLKIAGDAQQEALSLLDKLFAINPVNVHGRDLQARLLSSQQRLDEALQAIRAAITVDELPPFRLLEAQLLIRQRAYDDAETALKRLLTLEPENINAVIMLSAVHQQQKRNDDAESLLRQFTDQFPDAIAVIHALGKLLVDQKRIAEAILVYRDLASKTGENAEIVKTLGMLYFRYKDFDKAEATFRQLHESQPDEQTQFYLAASLEALKRTDEAKQLYTTIPTSSSLANEAQIRLAGMEFAEEKYSTAVERLNRVITKAPTETEAQLMRSAIRLAQQHYQKLLDETATIADSAKVHPQILFNRAVAFDHLKQPEQVDITLSRVLRERPNHVEALNFLGYTYAVQGIQLDKAERLIRKALQIKPDDGYYLDSLAWVFYKRGDYSKALSTQRQALKQIGDDAIMTEHLGDILWRKGDKTDARKAWTRAMGMKDAEKQRLQRKLKEGLKESE